MFLCHTYIRMYTCTCMHSAAGTIQQLPADCVFEIDIPKTGSNAIDFSICVKNGKQTHMLHVVHANSYNSVCACRRSVHHP